MTDIVSHSEKPLETKSVVMPKVTAENQLSLAFKKIPSGCQRDGLINRVIFCICDIFYLSFFIDFYIGSLG
jgi:hypothetical protein